MKQRLSVSVVSEYHPNIFIIRFFTIPSFLFSYSPLLLHLFSFITELGDITMDTEHSDTHPVTSRITLLSLSAILGESHVTQGNQGRSYRN